MRKHARYLIRFDDICPTMNWKVWSEVEAILLKYDIKPVLAVVPDNRDPNLIVDQPAPYFWEKVRLWQKRGWSIALHGYQHVYETKDSGLIGLTHQSEFAGLSREKQKKKLDQGLSVFKRENIHPDCWVAPSHSFDKTTIELLIELNIHVISDGLWPWPHRDEQGLIWIPAQLSGGARPNSRGGIRCMPSGIWTVCHHLNRWRDVELETFKKSIHRFSPKIIDLDKAVYVGNRHRLTIGDKLYSASNLQWNHRILPKLAMFLKRG